MNIKEIEATRMYLGHDILLSIDKLVAERLSDIRLNNTCSNCLHYAMGTCIFKRNCEMQGGISGYCYIEIDNPDEHYCADYEDRI